MARWGRGGCCDKSRPVGGWLPGGSGRLLTRVQFANSVDMVPGSRELIVLSLLAGLGCGLALIHGDLLFVAVFGGAIAMMTQRGDTTFTVRSSGTPSVGPKALARPGLPFIPCASADTEPAASPCVGKMVMATVLGLSAL
jgi:hypothetical protein